MPIFRERKKTYLGKLWTDFFIWSEIKCSIAMKVTKCRGLASGFAAVNPVK